MTERTTRLRTEGSKPKERGRRAECALLIVGSVAMSATGCASDECTRASEHLTACIGTDPWGRKIDRSVMPALRCEKETLCSARCVLAADCEALRSAFDGWPEPDADFAACQAQCHGTEVSP